MRFGRPGYTLIEIMIVVAIVAGLALFALPRFSGLSEASKMGAARQQVETAIATARASAIQKGRLAQFQVSGNKIYVTVDTNDAGLKDTILFIRPLDSLFQVKILMTNAPAQLQFEPRGWSVAPGFTFPLKYTLRGASRADTICVMKNGQLMPRGCRL